MASASIRLTNLTLLLLGTVIGLGVAEIALRVIGFNRPIVSTADSTLGNFRRPGISFEYTDEGRAKIEINRFGFRDRDHSVKKPPGVLRIAVLGDSYAEAYQVELAETFWSILAQKLNECDSINAKVEVLNFGVSGYGTGQELLMLRDRVWKFDPDVVLLAFLTGNDVRNNSKKLERVAPLRPFFSIDDRGVLVVDNSFRSDPEFVRASSGPYVRLRQIADRSRVLQLVSLGKASLMQLLSDNKRSGEAIAIAQEPGLDDNVYSDDAGPDWEEAWRITEALLREMKAEVSRHGARFIVMTLSNGVQVSPKASVTDQFAQSKGITSIFAPDDRIASMGVRNQFEVLSLAPTLQAVARERNIYMHGFGSNLGKGHWNQDGHRFAADTLSNYLCNETGLADARKTAGG